jgi:hypothetical protein
MVRYPKIIIIVRIPNNMQTLECNKMNGSNLTAQKCCEEKPIFEVEYDLLADKKPEFRLVCETHWNRQDEKGMKYFQVGVQSKRKI